MAQLQVEQIPVLSDNYVYLVHEPRAGVTGVVDPGGRGARCSSGCAPTAGSSTGSSRPTIMPITRAAISSSRRRPAAGSPGPRRTPRGSRGSISASPRATGSGSATRRRRCSRRRATPRATSATGSRDAKALFCADTLFSLGCGRVFEGNFEQMWGSLGKFAASAGRRAGLLRPRVHPGQCPLRAHRRPRQPGAPGARRRGRPPARGRQADRAQHARRRAGRQSVPARRRSGDPQAPRHGERERRGGVRRDPQAQGPLLGAPAGDGAVPAQERYRSPPRPGGEALEAAGGADSPGCRHVSGAIGWARSVGPPAAGSGRATGRVRAGL